MRIGQQRHRVQFQSLQVAQDASGQESTDWVNTFKAWVDISPLSGRELLVAQAEKSAISHKIVMRYRLELEDPTVVATMRILYRSRIFNIHASLNEDERDRQITLMAEEGLNNG